MSDTSDLIELLLEFTPLKPVGKMIGLMVGAGLEVERDKRAEEMSRLMRDANRQLAEQREVLDRLLHSHYLAAQDAVRQAQKPTSRGAARRTRLHEAIAELNQAVHLEEGLLRAGVLFILASCFDMLGDTGNALDNLERAYLQASQDEDIQYLERLAPSTLLPPLAAPGARAEFDVRYEQAEDLVKFMQELAALLEERRSSLETTGFRRIVAAHARRARPAQGLTLRGPSASQSLAQQVDELSQQARESAPFLGAEIPVRPRSAERARAAAETICDAIRRGKRPRWDLASSERPERIRRIARLVERLRQTGRVPAGQPTRYMIAGDASGGDLTPRVVVLIIHEDQPSFYVEVPLPVLGTAADRRRSASVLRTYDFRPGGPGRYLCNELVSGTALEIAEMTDRLLVEGLGAAPDYHLGLYRGEP